MFRLIDEEEHNIGLKKLINDFESNITLTTSDETLIWLRKI